MFGKIVEDLHGHKFSFDGKFEVSKTFPDAMRNSGKMSLNSDILTNEDFILLKKTETEYLFALYEEGIYKYGQFTSLISYNPKKDIRYIVQLTSSLSHNKEYERID